MLLHLLPAADWPAALAAGEVRPASLSEVGFVHLSGPEQVHLPAGRLFAGRLDVLLLVVDPVRLDAAVRYEPGVPGDPASMRFPHLYGPLPVDAVVAVLPWSAGSGVHPPAADDAAGRHAAHTLSLPVRRAVVAGEPVERRAAGWAVGSPDHPRSRDDNRLVLPAPADVARVVADTAPLVPGAAATVTWCWPGHESAAAALEDALRARGATVTADRVMARAVVPGPPPAGRAVVVDQLEVHPLWTAGWAADGLPADVVAELVGREHRTGSALRVVDVAVRESGTVVAAGQLRVDGATAAVESVQTLPTHRRRGLGDDVLARLLAEAVAAGCDLVVLESDAGDWPRHWYARRGFTDVGVTRSAVLPAGQAGTRALSSR